MTLPLGIYQHYKGPLYEVLDVCLHTETEELMVYYKPVQKTQTFVRPLAMFQEMIKTEDGVRPRFEFMSDLEV